MWRRRVSWQELRDAGHWKVEYFAGAPAAGPPSGWPLVAIGALAQERRVSCAPKDGPGPDEPVDYLGLEHVAPHTGDLVGFAPRLGSAVRSRALVFEAGDVLYGRLRPTLNKVFYAEAAQLAAGVCSTEFIVLTPDPEGMLPRLFRHLLASPFVQEPIVRFQSGAALPRVASRDLLALEIPQPPLPEQRRLERELAAADERRRHLQAELSALPADTEAALLAALAIGPRPPR